MAVGEGQPWGKSLAVGCCWFPARYVEHKIPGFFFLSWSGALPELIPTHWFLVSWLTQATKLSVNVLMLSLRCAVVNRLPQKGIKEEFDCLGWWFFFFLFFLKLKKLHMYRMHLKRHVKGAKPGIQMKWNWGCVCFFSSAFLDVWVDAKSSNEW